MTISTFEFDGKQLREKILDLAVRGKLVAQDQHDETTDILLSNIKAEKARLIKEKKIRRVKPSSQITDEEKGFDIPKNWAWVRLRDISNFMGGCAYKSKLYVKKSDNQVIRLGNVKNDQLALEKDPIFINDEYAKATNKYSIKEGNLLFTMTGTRNKRDYFFTLLVNRDDLQNKKLYLNQRVGCLNYIFNVDKHWLNYILKSQFILNEVFKNETGTANQGNIGAGKTMQIPIPLPPLEEQKRIAAKISRLFDQIDKIESASQQYAELRLSLRFKVLDIAIHGKLVEQDSTDEPASMLLDKIKAEKAELIKEKKIRKSKPLPEIAEDEKPFDIPDSWEWVRLGDIGSWAAGDTPSRQHPEYYGGNIPWLKTGDLTDGIVNTTSENITKLGVENSSVKLNKPGNVLIAMYGATIGKLGIVGEKEIVTNQACCGCSLFDGVYNWYLFYYLLASRKRLIELGSGGAQPNISKKKIENFVFPLPPLAEQKRIVTKLEKIFATL